MTINEIRHVTFANTLPNQEITASPQEILSHVTTNVDSSVIQFMMQDFMNDMYSSVEECPFSVNYKPDW